MSATIPKVHIKSILNPNLSNPKPNIGATKKTDQIKRTKEALT